MKIKLKKLLNKFLSIFKIRLVKLSTYKVYENIPRSLVIYSQLSESNKQRVESLLSKSKSQLAQDILVAGLTNNKEDNFFVEFGATDGITYSNTYLLEKELNWNGILVEPASLWHKKLLSNRNCIIDKRCVYIESGINLPFLVVDNDQADPSLSSLEKYAENGDWASDIRIKNSTQETVETITLNDLLDFHKAPLLINYLSIDTEGSEFDIINNFDFSKRKIKIISIEHNYNFIKRNKIKNLLEKNGYERIHKNISLFDDWYLLKN